MCSQGCAISDTIAALTHHAGSANRCVVRFFRSLGVSLSCRGHHRAGGELLRIGEMRP